MLLSHLADVEVEEVSRVGRYERRLLDTAIGGCEVVICLSVRRFLCLSPEYLKVTFARQVSGVTMRHARHTPAVTAVLEAVALALTGRLAAGVSRMTLIRLIRAMLAPANDQAPRVLGWTSSPKIGEGDAAWIAADPAAFTAESLSNPLDIPWA